MKTMVALVALAAFAVAAPMAFAKGDAADAMIKCCVKGECKDMSKADCKAAKGKVVKDCVKECKPSKK
jgi:hypothetical protein